MSDVWEKLSTITLLSITYQIISSCMVLCTMPNNQIKAQYIFTKLKEPPLTKVSFYFSLQDKHKQNQNQDMYM